MQNLFARLFGLNDAACQFFLSVVQFLLKLGCEQSSLDPALFFLSKDNCLVGMVVSHIDDFLHSGEAVFDSEVMGNLRRYFLPGKLEQDHFKYIGFHIPQENENLVLDQTNYTQELDTVVVTPARASQRQDHLGQAEDTQLRILVGCLNWAVQGSRPDFGTQYQV